MEIVPSQVPYLPRLGNLAALAGWIDGVEIAVTLAVLGILTDTDIHQPVVDHRHGDHVVASAAAAEFPDRALGIEVKRPQGFAGLGLVGPQPAVAAWEDYLRSAAKDGIRRIRPAAV